MKVVNAGDILEVKTGKYDANHAKEDGSYQFFTCAIEPLRTDTFSFNDEVIILPGNGANVGEVLYYCGKLEAYQRTYVLHNIKACPKYLYYYFKKYWIRQITKRQVGSATNYIKMDDIVSFQIPLPPLEQQKKIAAILDAADANRQLTKALFAKYDELTQALFLDMFGDPVKNEKGWEVKTIEKIVKENKSSIKRGPFGGALKKEIFVEDGYLVYEQFHALNNDFSMARYFIDESKFQELKGFEVKPKDIIISCSGVYLGKLAIIPENARKGIINQALLKITLDEEKMKNNFFVFLFSHKNFREKYFDANRGAGIPNFPPMSEFKKFPFITPPIALQNQFAERVQAIELQKAQAQASLEKSEALFNSLLQKAFKGEL